jgi:hypothetical protein
MQWDFGNGGDTASSVLDEGPTGIDWSAGSLPTGAGAYGIPLASAGTDLGGITSSTASPSGSIAGNGGNTVGLAALFSGLAQAGSNIYKATQKPQIQTPGVYYNPATGTYTNVPGVPATIGNMNTGMLLIIALAAVVLIFAVKK